MTKHTAGPWIVITNSVSFAKGVYGPRIAGQDRIWIADTDVGRMPENEANAQLIAAAPELLEALRGLVKWCDTNINGVPQEYGRLMADAEDAIAKAVKP